MWKGIGLIGIGREMGVQRVGRWSGIWCGWGDGLEMGRNP